MCEKSAILSPLKNPAIFFKALPHQDWVILSPHIFGMACHKFLSPPPKKRDITHRKPLNNLPKNQSTLVVKKRNPKKSQNPALIDHQNSH
jgi:hypothetical protein